MVAGSVKGLAPENVTVTDLEGRTLSGNGMQADSGFARQLEYRQRVEADLASKAEQLLVQMLGEGRAAVQVSADVDFTPDLTVAEVGEVAGLRPGSRTAGSAGVARTATAT